MTSQQEYRISSSPWRVVLSQRLGKLSDIELALRSDAVDVGSALLADVDAIRRNARDVDVIILGAVEPFGREAIESLPSLRAIVRRGVGVDNVDVDAATAAGVLVANVPDASVEEVSDHALACLLALERRAGVVDAMVRAGTWIDEPARLQQARVEARRFCDLTLGVVGFGRIGAAIARKARSVYGDVVVYDVVAPAPQRLAGARPVSLDELLATSDHVSLHLPMTAENRHLFGRNRIERMRAGAVLVNTARGGLVDEQAVVAALRSGHLAGAALDVTEQEPVPPDSPLLAPELAGRLLLTAHSAAWSETASRALAQRSVDAVAAVVQGRCPDAVVNPGVFEVPEFRLPGLRTAPGRAPTAQPNT